MEHKLTVNGTEYTYTYNLTEGVISITAPTNLVMDLKKMPTIRIFPSPPQDREEGRKLIADMQKLAQIVVEQSN